MNAAQETRINQFASRCLATCQKLLAQIKRAKEAILEEYRDSVQANEQLLRLALNEAEAIAWNTDYPHLFFPALAQEKAQAVASWNNHQREVRHSTRRIRLVA